MTLKLIYGRRDDAPIDQNHIVGWWPLNGNVQGYSGNGNQGTATGVTYTSTWTNGYTQP